MRLRPPAQVMRLSRMGAAFPTRLSFARQLIRAVAKEGAPARRRLWSINGRGHGKAIYTLQLGGREYALVCFSRPLAAAKRTDRVIAEAWDTTFALCDGAPSPAQLQDLARNVPRQEGGRYDSRVLVLSRANRSARLFDRVTAGLAAGAPPPPKETNAVGYLMRTTAVYGNGKFGIADRAEYAARPALAAPFQAELLAVWLIRNFTFDLAEHIAAQAGGRRAARLPPAQKRALGVGNSTGLGMAPFLVFHPLLAHAWAASKETALARVCALPQSSARRLARARALAARAAAHLQHWHVPDQTQSARLRLLREEWGAIRARLAAATPAQSRPWRRLMTAANKLSPECAELTAALLLEAHANIVNPLAAGMTTTQTPKLQPRDTTAKLRALLRQRGAWALKTNFALPQETRHFWYESANKQEPRRGLRNRLATPTRERPLDIARQWRRLDDALAKARGGQSAAEFLLAHPQHRNAVCRLQAAAKFGYAEIQDNLLGDECLPIDMLRWKLAFLGATRFDPKSRLWTRVSFFSGAPLCDEIPFLGAAKADDWWLTPAPQ